MLQIIIRFEKNLSWEKSLTVSNVRRVITKIEVHSSGLWATLFMSGWHLTFESLTKPLPLEKKNTIGNPYLLSIRVVQRG